MINKFVELVDAVNFLVDDKQITLLEPLPVDQGVDIVIQTKPININNPGNEIYQKFTATAQSDIFLLNKRPVNVEGYCDRTNPDKGGK